MSETSTFRKFEYGPPLTFEITWMNGHVERIQGHQVSWPNRHDSPFAHAGQAGRERVRIHGEINGLWTLQLDALVEDIRTIRNLATEGVAADEGAS